MLDRRIIELYDEYTHAPLDRRIFLGRLARLTGSAATAAAMLPLLESGGARAGQVAKDDARLETAHVTFGGEAGEVKAYSARLKEKSRLPGIIVIHENRGLNAHIEDVARRFALEGFLTLAPDLLSPLGGTPTSEDAARELIGRLDAAATVKSLQAAIPYLARHPQGNGKVGAVGFCWGGGMVGALAVNAPDLGAGVVYYGRQPKAEDVPRIEAPLLLHYAGLDTRINEGVAAFEAALKQAGTTYTLHMYEGADHAFNNDTSTARYNAEAAALAWTRTVEFFRQHLKG